MFCQISKISFRIFFTYFSIWNTPFRWNNQTLEIEVTKHKIQLLRWKLLLTFQLSHTVCIFILLYRSVFYHRISMDEFILLFPQLVHVVVCLSTHLTIWFYSTDMVFIFNQMRKNNRMFRKTRIPKFWNGFGILNLYFMIGAVIYPFICGCFFFFNRRGRLSIYSLVEVLADVERESVFLMFTYFCIEVMFVYCLGNTLLACCFVVCLYFEHSTHWMTLNETNWSSMDSAANYSKFQILRLHTSRFNGAFSNIFLASLKEILSVGLVLSSVTLIRYHNNLQHESLIMLGFLNSGSAIFMTAVFLPAGWVWKSSVKFKKYIMRKDSRLKRKGNYLCPFGIVIGSLYVVKGYTFVSLTHILMRYIFRLLVAFKDTN